MKSVSNGNIQLPDLVLRLNPDGSISKRTIDEIRGGFMESREDAIDQLVVIAQSRSPYMRHGDRLICSMTVSVTLSVELDDGTRT